MKRSHFTTPRSMDEATWYPWGAAIEKPYKGERLGFWDYVLLVFSVAIVSAAMWIFFFLVELK